MKKFSYTTSLLALAVAGYSGSAVSQQTCQNEIQQLRSENQQRQVPESERERVRQILDRATRADATDCERFVADARTELERAQGQEQSRQGTLEAVPVPSGGQTAQQSSQQQSIQQQPAQQQSSRQQPAQQRSAQTQGRQQATQPTQSEASGLAPTRQDTKMQVQIEQMPATVEVDSGAPRVVVRQQPPKVTVEQQPPIVEITQPEARVNVTQAEPKVTVNQSNPQVDIQQADPQVEVLQAGEPQVRMVGPDSEGSRQATNTRQESAVASSQLQQTERQGLVTTGQISSEEASQLEGKSVLSSQGEEVGEISDIVRSQADNELHAVVDVGGFLGIGARSVAIPVQQGQIGEDGNLQVPLSREQLEQLPEYDDSQYDSEDL